MVKCAVEVVIDDEHILIDGFTHSGALEGALCGKEKAISTKRKQSYS